MEWLAFPSTEAEFRAGFAQEGNAAPLAPGGTGRTSFDGFRCAPCAGKNASFLPSKRVVDQCAGGGRQVSLIAGTIFEQSKKPLALWCRAIVEATGHAAQGCADRVCRQAHAVVRAPMRQAFAQKVSHNCA